MDAMISRWFEHAKWSASGGNAQPWKASCSWSKDQVALTLRIDEEYQASRHSPMDVDGWASVWALGALALNLEVCAAHDGFEAKEHRFEHGHDFWDAEVEIVLVKNTEITPTFELADLFERRTNRSPFEDDPMPPDLQARLNAIIENYKDTLILGEATGSRKQAAKRLIHIERLRWKTAHYFDSLLEEVSFDPDAEFGIPSDQLGLSKMDTDLLRANKRFKPMRKLIHLGSYLLLSYQNLVKTMNASAHVFFMQAKADDLETNFWFGAAYQEMWTELNRSGFAFQPISVSLIAMGLQKKAQPTRAESRAIREAKGYFRDSLNLDMNLPIMGFRTGRPTQAVGKSPRREIAYRTQALRVLQGTKAAG